jgi:hypothetical protein
VTAPSSARAAASAMGMALEGRFLRFATIGVNQFRSRAWREPDVRPVLRGITSFERRTDGAGGNKLLKATWTAALRQRPGRNKFGHDAAMGGNRDTLAGFDSADITAQIVFQVANAS